MNPLGGHPGRILWPPEPGDLLAPEVDLDAVLAIADQVAAGRARDPEGHVEPGGRAHVLAAASASVRDLAGRALHRGAGRGDRSEHEADGGGAQPRVPSKASGQVAAAGEARAPGDHGAARPEERQARPRLERSDAVPVRLEGPHPDGADVVRRREQAIRIPLKAVPRDDGSIRRPESALRENEPDAFRRPELAADVRGEEGRLGGDLGPVPENAVPRGHRRSGRLEGVASRSRARGLREDHQAAAGVVGEGDRSAIEVDIGLHGGTARADGEQGRGGPLRLDRAEHRGRRPLDPRPRGGGAARADGGERSEGGDQLSGTSGQARLQGRYWRVRRCSGR